MSAAVVGAGLALFAASRAWTADAAQPSGGSQTGADLVPWLSAVALAALAGAGATVATHGVLRRMVGVLLGLFGSAIAGAGGYGMVDGGSGWLAPAATIIGGVLVITAGVTTALYGASWPAMGARYQRDSTEPDPPVETDNDGQPERSPPPGSPASMAMWDALDRGEDPTR